jgi:hypothetical protein
MPAKLFLTMVLALVLVLAGCLPVSVHGLAKDSNDVVYEPGLVGLWQEDANDPNSKLWQFEFSGDCNNPAYKLRYDEKDKDPGEFRAMVVAIGDQRFLDIYPGDPNYKLPFLTICGYVKVHVLAKIEQTSPTLRLCFMDQEKVSELLKKSPDLIAHEINDDERIILTAPPQELQKFVVEKQNNIFGTPSNMRRLVEGGQQ